MPRYRSSVDVPLPPAETLAFVTDFRNAARWDPLVRRVEKPTPGPVGVGTRFVLYSGALGLTKRLPYEVVELVPSAGDRPGRAVLVGRTKLLRYRDEIEVTDRPDGARIVYDARVSLRGPLSVADPLLSVVFRRIGEKALAGIAAAVAQTSRERAGGPVPRPDGTPETVRAIAALAERPVLRNLLITQSYHALSERLADLLGRENLNWCSFATWASRHAGSFIREETLGRDLRRALQEKARFRRRLHRFLSAMEEVDEAAMGPFGSRDDLGPILEVARQVSRFIRRGNRIVFEELGAVLAGFVADFADDRGRHAAGLEAFVAKLRPGAVEPDHVEMTPDGELVSEPRGGQELLRRAVRAYHAALNESDPKRKAELILLGSALGGLHEQTRLQPYVAAALEAPVDEILYSRHHDALVQRLKGAVLGRAQEALDRWFAPLGEELLETWRELSTRKLTTLPTPAETLRLGRDLPAPPGSPLYPPLLERLDDGELVGMLERYAAYDPSAPVLRRVAPGSGARDWALLDERMRFILTYFRSRQREESQLSPPFTDEQLAMLEAGRVPTGEL